MHASIMIFFVIIPLLVGTFGNYLVPLKIGAGDMAFPFLNGLAFWSSIPAGSIMVTGFFLPGNAASAGWTSYPPLSAIQFNGGGGVVAPGRWDFRLHARSPEHMAHGTHSDGLFFLVHAFRFRRGLFHSL